MMNDKYFPKYKCFFFLAYKYMDANTASHSSNKKKITFNVNKILVLKT